MAFPEAEIAGMIGIDPKSLRKHYRQELDHAHTKANIKVAENLFRKATGEGREAVTAAIFWLKARAREKDATIHEHGGVPGQPIEQVHAIRRIIISPARTAAAPLLDHTTPNGKTDEELLMGPSGCGSFEGRLQCVTGAATALVFTSTTTSLDEGATVPSRETLCIRQLTAEMKAALEYPSFGWCRCVPAGRVPVAASV
jgi:hypothetical protein